MDSRQARRRSAEALARSFQMWRETVPPTEEPMEVEEVPDSSTYARAKGSSKKGRKTSSSSQARAGGSSQGVGVSEKKLPHAKREGKKPMEPNLPLDGGATDEDEQPKAAKKPHKRNRPSAAKYLEVLLARGFEGTRYPHRETMMQLGIARDVEYLYETGGLCRFMSMQMEAYKEETCHFLSSLAVHFYDEEPDYEPDGGPGFITFTCRSRPYTLTIKEISTLYGFSEGIEPVQDIDHEELLQLWSTIGDTKPYSSSRSKSSSIRSPVLRYLHKTIANTMFARKVTGTVNEGELKMMDLCLLPLLGYTRDGLKMRGDRADANLTFVLLEQLLYYKEWAMRMHKMESGGELCIGGIITPILVACNVELISEPYPPKWIDVDALRRCSFLDHTTPLDKHLYKFMHLTIGEAKLRLPCTDLTKVRMGQNIDFDPPLDRLYNPDEEIMHEDTSPDDHVAVEEEDDTTERYAFEEYSLKPSHSPALKEAHKRIGLLQKWNKFQGKTISKLKGTVKELKDQMKEVKDQLKDFKQKFTAPASKKIVLPRRVLVGSGSFREEPRPPAPSMEPPRASSFEPRQLQHYERKKKRRSQGTTSSSSRQLDHGGRARHTHTPDSSHQLEHTQVESAYTRESMEDSISSFFSKP